MSIQQFDELASFMGSCFNSFFQNILTIQIAGVSLLALLSIIFSIGIVVTVFRKATK